METRIKSKNKFESARKKFLRKPIDILFVAEAPPPLDSCRFFYFVEVTRGDSLFLEMMKVLYPDRFISAPELRARKKEFLDHFKEDGFYLIDACEAPLPRRAKKSLKKIKLREGLPCLKEKLKDLCDPDTKIVLISKPVYDVCSSALGDFNVINSEMIDFPAASRQPHFREKLARLLSRYKRKNN